MEHLTQKLKLSYILVNLIYFGMTGRKKQLNKKTGKTMNASMADVSDWKPQKLWQHSFPSLESVE